MYIVPFSSTKIFLLYCIFKYLVCVYIVYVHVYHGLIPVLLGSVQE